MKKIFKLEGLACACCAEKMEKAVSGLDGVVSAKVNFMTAKITIEASDEKMDAIETAAAKAVKKIESHVKLIKA